MKTILSTLLASLLLQSSFALAQNRDDSDSMFPPKTDTTLVEQAVIGVAEYVLFNALHVKEHGLTPLQNQLNNHDQSAIAAAREALDNPDTPAAKKELLKKQILAAENAILERNARAVSNLKAAELRAKGINRLLYTGQALIVVDMFGRLYVWQKLDRDPTISPIAQFVLKSVQGK